VKLGEMFIFPLMVPLGLNENIIRTSWMVQCDGLPGEECKRS